MPKSQSRKKRSPRRVLALPDLEHAKTAVLNSLTSASGQRTYDHAIREFVGWYCSEPRLAFNRTDWASNPTSRDANRPRAAGSVRPGRLMGSDRRGRARRLAAGLGLRYVDQPNSLKRSRPGRPKAQSVQYSLKTPAPRRLRVMLRASQSRLDMLVGLLLVRRQKRRRRRLC
jgi:hypothetical protein